MQTPIELNEGVSDIRVKGRAKTLERQRREWGETGRQKRDKRVGGRWLAPS